MPVLAPPFTARPAAPAEAAGRAWVTGALLLLLPMLFQSFHYMIDVGPLYLLSKGWPLLMLPFALYGLAFLRLPYAVFYALLLAYVMGVTPFLSVVQLHSSFAEAMVATNNVWPLIYYFAGSAVLHILRPAPAQLRRAILILAGVTFAAFWLLWLLAPVSAYRSSPTESQVFYFEFERGYRVVLPIGFAAIGLFHTARRFCEDRRLWRLALLAAGFLTLALIYKQRTSIAASAAITLYILSGVLRPRWRALLIGIAAAGGAAAAVLQPPGLTESLGSSLSIREHSASLAFDFIRDDPLRWLFGAGSTTAYNAVTLQDILGFDFFYVTDLGWLGVVFVYGLAGAALIACFDLASWRLAVAAGRVGGAWLQAVGDYALYLLMVSAVYSVVYVPGEMATIAAIAVYGLRAIRAGETWT